MLFCDDNDQLHVYKVSFEKDMVSKMIKHSILSIENKIEHFINLSGIIRL
jgi:hypothetical protein